MTTPPRPASVAILIVAPAIVLCAGALATLFAVASLIAVEAAGHGRLSAEIVGGMIAICGLPVSGSGIRVGTRLGTVDVRSRRRACQPRQRLENAIRISCSLSSRRRQHATRHERIRVSGSASTGCGQRTAAGGTANRRIRAGLPPLTCSERATAAARDRHYAPRPQTPVQPAT